MAWDIEHVKQELSGPSALVMVPFNDDLSLNMGALTKNIRYMIDGGMRTGSGHMICPCGTGEYLTLSAAEHRRVVETAVEASAGELPLVAGVARININEVIEMAESAQQAGAKYVMVSPTFYDPIDQDGIFEWYRILNESVGAGIMIYDQSWRTDLGTTLSLPLIERLAELKNLVSLKFGAPEILKVTVEAMDKFADRFAFIDNSLGYISTIAHMHGASDFISGPSVWWPEFELEFFDMMQRAQYAKADRWHARLGPWMALINGEFARSESFFHQAAIMKASLEYVGQYGGPVRPPFRAMNAQEKLEVFAVLEDLGAPKG